MKWIAAGALLLSAAGVAAVPVSNGDAMNLALYRGVWASTSQDFARYATDGVVGSDFKWIGSSGASLPQNLYIYFPGPVEIGSCHLYTGVNNANLCSAWKLQYRLNGSPWVDVPGSAVAANTASERNIVFPSITVDELRLWITASSGDGRPRVREWAVFPPNGGSGYPLGTGVTLNMAQDGLATASTHASGQYPRLASDGYLGTAWVSGSTAPHTLEVTLRDEINIGSAHIYSGDGTPGSAIANFSLEYSNNGGATWSPVPGGTVAGNTSTERAVTFSSVFAASMVRLTSTDPGPVTVREFVVFPDNNAGGYSLNTDVNMGSPPSADYETYSDSIYRIRSVSANVVLTGGGTVSHPDHRCTTQNYQLLLNPGTDTYRIFNSGTRKCLAVKDAALTAGAEVIEETYAAFPSQQWQLLDAGGGLVYIRNVFSSMRFELFGNIVIQMPENAIAKQQWKIEFHRGYPKKGAAGYWNHAADMGASWYYGWTTKDDPAALGPYVDFNPMQWGDYNWDPDNYNWPDQLPLTVYFPNWRSRGNPMVFFGFNEPDSSSQANITVEKAIEYWPRMMASGLPLASPATVGWNNTWMNDWMAEADNRGYQVDYLAMHIYPNPNAANLAWNIADFSAAHDNRPVILSEFGFVDWNNSENWTENLMYNEMLSLLWLMEEMPECKRYSLFGYQEEAGYLQPADPTGRVRRSNWKYSDGSFTPLGEAYMGWDGDTTPNSSQPYILHNRALNMRVSNTGSASVGAVNIRTGDASAQVVFQPIGNGYNYIVSSLDGKRLRKTSATTVEWAAPTTTTTDAQWNWSLMDSGWQLISNRDGGNLRYDSGSGVHMGTASGSYYHWFFVPPMNPAGNIALLEGEPSIAPDVAINNTAAAAGQSSYDFGPATVSAFVGESATIPNALINSANLNYIGVNSSAIIADSNVNAINDTDGVAGGADQDRLRIEMKPGSALTRIIWHWSRADGPLATDGVSISGFAADPCVVFSGGISGMSTYSDGTLRFQISGFNGTQQAIFFTNYEASKGTTLEITVADSDQAGPQLAIRSLSFTPPGTLFYSDFDNTVGAAVLPGAADNVSGSAAVSVPWSRRNAVTSMSDLTAVIAGDGGTASGFVQLYDGTAPYANADNLFIGRNHYFDIDRSTSKRGYSLDFTVDKAFSLDKLTVLSGHATANGVDQVYTSTLVCRLSGGTLAAPVTSGSVEDYTPSIYNTVVFNLTGIVIGAGTYTLEVYQTQMTGGGAYAIFNGLALEAVTAVPIPGSMSMGALQDHPSALATADLLAVGTDPDGDPLDISSVGSTSSQGGTVELAGEMITYTPAIGYVGADEFTYTLSDDQGADATGTVNVNVVADDADYNRLSPSGLISNAIELGYQGIPWEQYAFERAANLMDPVVWIPVYTNIAGSDGWLNFTNSTMESEGYFRVRSMP